jgi:hypothetical protein
LKENTGQAKKSKTMKWENYTAYVLRRANKIYNNHKKKKMQTLQIDKNKALKLYPNATPEFKEMLIDTFGEKFFSRNIIERLQTFQDACEITGKSIGDESDTYKSAEKAIEIFAEALREGKPASECFYYPYFLRSSGGGFSFGDCDYDRDTSSVGARLRVDTTEKARHLGTMMLPYYKVLLNGN